MGTTFAELYARRAELTALADEADRVIAQARALGLDTDADREHALTAAAGAVAS